MILPFMTHFKHSKKPTYFVPKILNGIKEYSHHDKVKVFGQLKTKGLQERLDIVSFNYFSPKIHTCRLDKNNRWKAGRKIHFYLWNRTKRAYCFLIAPCKSVQTVMIDAVNKKVFLPYEDCKEIDVDTFARNDGFDSVADFWSYFNQTQTYKLIHWTDFKY